MTAPDIYEKTLIYGNMLEIARSPYVSMALIKSIAQQIRMDLPSNKYEKEILGFISSIELSTNHEHIFNYVQEIQRYLSELNQTALAEKDAEIEKLRTERDEARAALNEAADDIETYLVSEGAYAKKKHISKYRAIAGGQDETK